jgi:hypothetical protein
VAIFLVRDKFTSAGLVIEEFFLFGDGINFYILFVFASGWFGEKMFMAQ